MLPGLLALALAAGAPLKLAVMPVASGEGVPGKTAEALTESVTAEVRRRSGAQVITQKEIATLLSLEQQKSLLGCQSDACFAEIGGALGVERVVSGDLSRLGESWLLHLKLLDAAKAQVLATSDRRLRGGTIDDVLDALPAMVADLFAPASPAAPTAGAVKPGAATPGAGAAATPAGPAAAGTARPALPEAGGGPPITPAVVQLAPAVSPGPTPELEPQQQRPPEVLPPPTAPMPGRTPARAVAPAFVERSIAVPLRVRADLQVYGDGAGHLLAVAPFGGEAPVFFGGKRKLVRQEVLERREHGTTGYEVAIREPRVPGGLAFVALRGEEAVVRCGDRDLSLRALPDAERKAVLLATTYYAAPLVRRPYALARDDEGNFFFVDAAREPGRRGPDYRLYAGPRGAMARQEIQEIGSDGGALVLRTAKGRLRLQPGREGEQADWLAAGGRRMLVRMDPAENEPLVFGELGVYAGQPLGTPCDVVLTAP